MYSLAKGRSAITGDRTQQAEYRQVFLSLGKKKASNTEKLCWSFEFSHQNSTPLQHLQGEQTPYRKESLVKKEAKQGVLSTALDSPSLSPQPSLLPPQPPLTLRRPCPVAPLEQVKPHLPTAVCVRAHEAHTVFAASQHHKWLF